MRYTRVPGEVTLRFHFLSGRVKTWIAEIKTAGTGCAEAYPFMLHSGEIRERKIPAFHSNLRRPQNCVPCSKNNNSGAPTDLVPVGLVHLALWPCPARYCVGCELVAPVSLFCQWQVLCRSGNTNSCIQALPALFHSPDLRNGGVHIWLCEPA